MRTSNPILSNKTFDSASTVSGAGTMSIQGVTHKTFMLLIISLISASWVWKHFFAGTLSMELMPLMVIGAVGGFILAIITIFSKKTAFLTAPLYCLFEGLLIGSLSAIVEKSYPGLVIQAVGLTFGVLFVLLALYRNGVFKVTDQFRMGVFAATGAIAMIYFVSMIMRFFGSSIPFIHSSGTLGIVFSLVVVVIASMNLILDFDFIERASHSDYPQYMEWYAAFGLMVTLIWLYIEILRLLVKLQRRR